MDWQLVASYFTVQSTDIFAVHGGACYSLPAMFVGENLFNRKRGSNMAAILLEKTYNRVIQPSIQQLTCRLQRDNALESKGMTSKRKHKKGPIFPRLM